MDWQGKINFHKPITINGKYHGIEHESTLPTWTSSDNGRVVHAEDSGKLWFGTDIEWDELTPGGVGAHNHDDRYYTETEVDAFFEGESGGKKIIDYTSVQNKPLTFPPDVHDHDDRYYTETEVDNLISAIDVDAATYEKLDAAGDVGTSAGQLAIGNHVHSAQTVTYNNASSGLASTDVKNAIDEVQSNIESKTTNIIPLTAGVPTTTPITGTMEFDESTNILYIYNGTAWVSTTLA